MKLAYVIGNGKSRVKVNLSQLKKPAEIFGCNAIYRDFLPDHLVSVNPKMTSEILASEESKQKRFPAIWTYKNNVDPVDREDKRLNYIEPEKGWSSGPAALWLACSRGATHVYVIGFDYSSNDGKINNVYAGTTNYAKADSPATHYDNWIRQTQKVISLFPDVEFFRAVDQKCLKFDFELPNLKHITLFEIPGMLPAINKK